MASHVVAHKRDLPAGSRILVSVQGRQIGIFNLQDKLYAVLNRCADQGGPVCQGGLFDNVKAEVLPDGRIRDFVDDLGCIVACPWHGWEYDLRTGRCLWNPDYHLRLYRVHEDDQGNVVLDL